IAVLNTTSPSVRPSAPTDTPLNTVPSSSASIAGSATLSSYKNSACENTRDGLQARQPIPCLINGETQAAIVARPFVNDLPVCAHAKRGQIYFGEKIDLSPFP